MRMKSAHSDLSWFVCVSLHVLSLPLLFLSVLLAHPHPFFPRAVMQRLYSERDCTGSQIRFIFNPVFSLSVRVSDLNLNLGNLTVYRIKKETKDVTFS